MIQQQDIDKAIMPDWPEWRRDLLRNISTESLIVARDQIDKEIAERRNKEILEKRKQERADESGRRCSST